MTKSISDDKALLLNHVSTQAKRLVGVDRLNLTTWTEQFEGVIAKLSNQDLCLLNNLLVDLGEHRPNTADGTVCRCEDPSVATCPAHGRKPLNLTL